MRVRVLRAFQNAGRLQRLRPGKSQVWVFDYLDREVPMLRRMFEIRRCTHRALGYEGDGRLPGQESKTEEV